jgi:hypothetical protein
MDSRTNLVVDITHHGEPSTDYQHPGIEMEPIYSNCGTVEDKSNGHSGSDENDDTNQYGECSSTSGYQQPRKISGHAYSQPNPPVVSKERSRIANQVNQHSETSTPSDYQHPKPNLEHTCNEYRVDYQQPKFTPSKPPRNPKSSPPPSERYKKPPIKNWKAPTNYQTPSQHTLQTKYLVPPTPKSAPPSPELAPSSPPLDTDITFLEGGEQNREDETASSITKPSSGQNLPTAVKSQLPSPNSGINEKSNREADYEVPEIDAEFLESEGFNRPQPTPSLSHVDSDREAGYQVPEIDSEFLENEGFNPPQPSPSLGNVEVNRESGYLDMNFFESGDKSLIPPSIIPPSSSSPPALPSRTPSQKAPSTSLVPPALPSKTAPQNSLFARPTKASPNSEPPALPSKTRSQKSPSVRPLMAATSSPPPTLPLKSPSVKSPKMVPSKPLISPQLPPKARPPLPAKTKPGSSPSPAFYAELNELDMRQDDAANYQPLTLTTKR